MRPLPLFEMLQPGVEHFFDAVQLGAPHVFRVVEPLIDRIEPRIHVRAQIAEAGVVNEYSYKYGDRGNTNGKGDLNGLIGHHCLQNTPSAAGARGGETTPVWVAVS
jgi:hypothetical protein